MKYLISQMIAIISFGIVTRANYIGIWPDLTSNSQIIYITCDNNPLDIYPFSKMDSLIEKTKSELSDTSLTDAGKDEIFIGFLDAQAAIINEFNDTLYEDPNYEKYNHSMYPGAPHDPLVIQFNKKITAAGIAMTSSEGMLYLKPDISFLGETFLDHLSPGMQEVFLAYSVEVDQECCEDGALIISMNELVVRTLMWEELSQRYPDMTIGHIDISEMYRNYLGYLLLGTDNTPAFNEDNDMLEESFKESFEKIPEKYPKSKTAKVIEEYIVLLKKYNYKLSEEIMEFVWSQ